MRRNTRHISAMLVVACLVSTAMGAAAQEIGQTFQARIIDTKNALPDRTSTNLRFGLDSVTPDEEVVELARVLAEQGPRALTSRLEKLDRGWIQFGARSSYPLSFVRVFEREEGGRLLRLMTHRPIGMAEAFSNFRTTDYPFTILEIQLDENDRGEGRMMVGAKLEFEGTQLEVTSYGLEPFQVVPVMETGKKKKKT